MRFANLLALCIALQLTSLAAGPPRFSDFKVPRVYHGRRTAPKVPPDKTEYPGFRSVLGDAGKPPNFAGRYVVSQDTCGSDSTRLFIADAATGRVYEEFCMFWDYVVFRDDVPWGLEYRRDSSLLIAHGCWDAEEPQCGNHYFRMTARGLREIRWIPFHTSRPLIPPGAAPRP